MATLETLLSNPVVLIGGTAGLAVFAGITAYKKLSNQDEETIDAEGMKQRFNKIYTGAVKSQGSKVGAKIKIRGTSNTPRTLGYALKAKDMDQKVRTVTIDKDSEDSSPEEEIVDSEGTIYDVVEGSEGVGLKLKVFASKLGVGKWNETYDIPSELIHSSDDAIWLDSSAHFVKFNGVKRDLSVKGLGRGQEASFSKVHENFLETMGSIPEQYATLNNRISGQLKMENIKSENIRKFKQGEELEEKELD